MAERSFQLPLRRRKSHVNSRVYKVDETLDTSLSSTKFDSRLPVPRGRVERNDVKQNELNSRNFGKRKFKLKDLKKKKPERHLLTGKCRFDID